MRFFFPAMMISSISGAKQVTLEDVYGPVPKVEAMTRPSEATQHRVARHASFSSARTPENCDFPLEILIVQDLTASFNDNFDAMVNTQLPLMFKDLGASHPNSTYGVLTFRDKPIAPLGTPATDYCAKVGLDFTSNTSAVTDFYRPLLRVGGGDPSENQFGALLAATETGLLTWSGAQESSKLIVMVTDAPPHFEGDGDNAMGLKKATGLYNDDTAEVDCIQQYYPSPDQVLESLHAIGSYFAVLVYDPQYWSGLPATSWKWFNRFIGQTDDFANLSANDQSDFWAVLQNVIKSIEALECVETTTAAPTTTKATTTAAPTTTKATTTAAPTAAPTTAPTTTKATTTAAPTASAVGSTQLPPPECDETTICDEGVLIKIGFEPAAMNVVVNGHQIAKK